MRYLLAVMVLCLCVAPVCAQTNAGISMEEALSGKNWPLTLKVSDLNASWFAVDIETQNSDPSSAIIMAAVMASSGMGITGNAVYTKGETASLSGTTFLVGYKAKMDPIDPEMLSRMSQMPVQTINAETPLLLTLINVQSIGYISRIRTFNLEEESKAPQMPNMAEFGGAPEEEDVQTAAANAESQSNLHRLAAALVMYTSDSSDKLPSMQNLDALKVALKEYAEDESIYTQPGTDKPYAINTVLSDHKVAHIARPSEMVVFYEAEPGADKARNVAFLDGHVSRVSESEWLVLKKKSKIP